MLELIEALVIERPKRSVVFAWTTAEERGLVGAFHFIQHCPVPVERISANLNLDMISRNDPGLIYLVGSKALSTELDGILRAANDRSSRLRVDDSFQSPAHPERFFFRSDQYPHIQYGIPGVWIFCGTTPDYHTPQDAIDRVDYAKMEKVTRFAYVACLDIGNAPAMMRLDVRPDVTSRGAHNMEVDWLGR
jgi:Zn-dependent M28 family amino/carboxypeptidase